MRGAPYCGCMQTQALKGKESRRGSTAELLQQQNGKVCLSASSGRLLRWPASLFMSVCSTTDCVWVCVCPTEVWVQATCRWGERERERERESKSPFGHSLALSLSFLCRPQNQKERTAANYCLKKKKKQKKSASLCKKPSSSREREHTPREWSSGSCHSHVGCLSVCVWVWMKCSKAKETTLAEPEYSLFAHTTREHCNAAALQPRQREREKLSWLAELSEAEAWPEIVVVLEIPGVSLSHRLPVVDNSLSLSFPLSLDHSWGHSEC